MKWENGARPLADLVPGGMAVFISENNGSYRRLPWTDFAVHAGFLAASSDGQMLTFGGADGTPGILNVKNHVWDTKTRGRRTFRPIEK